MFRFPLAFLLLLACSDGAGKVPAAVDPVDSPAAGQPATGDGVRLQEVASGLNSPVYLTAPAGDARLFVVEQPGRIRVVENGRLLATPFLDISDRVRSGGERGLLSVAFHPGFARNGYLYVNYTDRAGNTQIERFRVGADRNRADAGSARRILSVDQPYANHNGGLVLFGPDGKLYIGMGDGGSGGDPLNHGQNPNTLLGAMLRIDVDAGEPYAVPADNPFVGQPGKRPEIWATGLRNPWRFSFDRKAGLLYIADVGQNAWEEVHVEPAGRAGVNYGWKVMEGRHCFRADSCARAGLSIPPLEYAHDQGCSITGGYVYRGRAIPSLAGRYVYGDFCKGWVRSFRYSDGRAMDDRAHPVGDAGQILSFGEDSAGELYLLSSNGRVYRLAPA